jgi:hypothetical protein
MKEPSAGRALPRRARVAPQAHRCRNSTAPALQLLLFPAISSPSRPKLRVTPVTVVLFPASQEPSPERHRRRAPVPGNAAAFFAEPPPHCWTPPSGARHAAHGRAPKPPGCHSPVPTELPPPPASPRPPPTSTGAEARLADAGYPGAAFSTQPRQARVRPCREPRHPCVVVPRPVRLDIKFVMHTCCVCFIHVFCGT